MNEQIVVSHNTFGDSIQELKAWILFIGFALIYILISWFTDQYILTDDLYFRSFQSEYSIQVAYNFIDLKARYAILGYVFAPLILLVKTGYIFICISTGMILTGLKVDFKKVYKVILVSEIVFLVGQVIYLVNLSFSIDVLTLETMPAYYPLSLLGFFDFQQVPDWLQYSLQNLNAFQVIYVSVLAWLVAQTQKVTPKIAAKGVVLGYMIGIALWLLLVIFLSLQLS